MSCFLHPAVRDSPVAYYPGEIEPQLYLTFDHLLICTVLLDPRVPLLQSERTQGFAADPDYWKGEVFAYVGLPQNLKDLKDSKCLYLA